MVENNIQRISCLIPTFNEEERIGHILKILVGLKGSLLDEIIVIDDGSSDTTTQIVSTFKEVTLLRNKCNKGKSFSIVKGIENARNELLLMIDGDLIGITANNIRELIQPILNKTADITISYRGNTPKWWIRLFKIETFSGERCFSKSLLVDFLEELKNIPGYGLEVFMNNQCIIRKLRIASVPMNNVTIKFKWHKHGWLLGIWKEILMWKHIFSVVNPLKLLRQVLDMKKLMKD